MGKDLLSVKVLGVKETQAFLRSKDKEILNVVKVAIGKGTLFLEGEVVESVSGRRDEPRSVDTGAFKQSVRSKSSGLKGEVFSNIEYAPLLEFGTSTRKARRHFRNSTDRNRKKIIGFVEEEVKKATK